MAITKTNPYLEGNFAPVSREIEADNLEVIGEIPTKLRGMFLRNGPNPQFKPTGEYHWFDGDGMVHGVEIKQGKASYLNRYVQTRGFKLMDNPYGPSKNTANTALVYHAKQLLALWEGGKPHALTVPSLETLGLYDYEGKLTSPFTAHPKIDPETGEMRFFGYSLAEPPHLQYGLISAQGELLWTKPIDLPVGVMMHDFAITANYTIFLDLPLTFRAERAKKGEAILQFENERPSRFGVLPKYGNPEEIRWFTSDPSYIFHTLNAYEQEDEIILMACRMEGTTVLGEATEKQRKSDIPYLHEWRFNQKTGQVKEKRLCDLPSEFPRVNEQYLGQKIRYGYSGKMAASSEPKFEGVIKHDLERGDYTVHDFGHQKYGGEAVFAPNPEGKNSDEGWLLTFVHDEEFSWDVVV